MKLTRWEWVYKNKFETVTHTHTVSREEGWKEVEFAPDEKVYWTGHPERIWLRWEMLFCPLVGVALCWLFADACRSLMIVENAFPISLVFLVFSVFFVIPIVRSYRLKFTTYIFTDRRIIIENARRKWRCEYDLVSYLKDFGGLFFPVNREGKTWQPGNRWDATLIWSRDYSSGTGDVPAPGLGVEFRSLPKSVYDIIRQAETEIRLKHRAPTPSPFDMKIVRSGFVYDYLKHKKQKKQAQEQATKQQ